ncbi:sterile alpha motif domain-containing protein 13 isoform X2 [Erpetoichthys calabaricus]|uniref:sterile alpha motif domain-containing protein 13 isoform X2 n=1 Tax=Erpetoichthys calabaricus TaxID=27687 RepID=UPI0022342BE7|nr:sterile alpha motif domain-containing protein 13 isoform X2 [Erpetoichthys calabaricus]
MKHLFVNFKQLVRTQDFNRMENKENGSVDTKNLVENGQLPDPAEWAVLDVVNYFKAVGFEEQANAFQDQMLIVCQLITWRKKTEEEELGVGAFDRHSTAAINYSIQGHACPSKYHAQSRNNLWTGCQLIATDAPLCPHMFNTCFNAFHHENDIKYTS